MITVILNVIVAIVAALVLTFTGLSAWYWSILWAVLILVAGQLAIGWVLRRRLSTVNERVQAVMVAAQAKMQAKVQRWRTKQMSNQKAAEAELAKDRDAMIAEVNSPPWSFSSLGRRRIGNAWTPCCLAPSSLSLS